MKKPSLKKFTDACNACKGVVTKIAQGFGVNRKTIYAWCHTDQAFQDVLDEYKGRLLDECLNSAKLLALGIPKLDEKKRVIGWIERPDGYMLKYLLSTLGKREGFGENIDITTNGESVKQEPVILEIIDKREQVNSENPKQE